MDPVVTWVDGSTGGTPVDAANLNEESVAIRDLQKVTAFNDRGPVQASTAYAVGDLITYNGQRVVILTAVTSDSSSFISASNYGRLAYLPMVDIRDFGAAVDGTTDDTTAIRNAIASFATSGFSDPGTGGIVFFPPGYTMISGTLDIGSNIHLMGAGLSASVIQLLPNSNCHMVTTHRSTGSGDSNAFWCSVSNLMLDGRRANQGHVLTDVTMRPGSTTLTSAGGTFQANGTLITGIGLLSGTTIVSGGGTNTVTISQAPIISALQQAPGGGTVYQGGTTDVSSNPVPWCGIYHETNPYNSGQTGDTQFDPTHHFYNLRIYFIQGDGIRIHGRSDVAISNVKVTVPTGNGFTIDFDTSITDCITDHAHIHGLEIPGHSSDRIANCKFYNSYGAGIYAHGNANGELTMAGNDLQQNNWDGLRIESQTQVYFSGTISDSGFSNSYGDDATVTTWTATHAYGDFRSGPPAIVVPTVANGFVYACYIAGTSGGSQPTWPTTVGNTVVDGSVTWVCMAGAPASVALLNASDCIVDAITQYDLNALRITGSSTANAVRIAHTANVTGAVDVSTDSITLTGSTTNSVLMNGRFLTGMPVGAVTLTDAATIATDASLGDRFRVTLGGNRTLGNPTNPTDGQICTWVLIQDATGSRTLTLGSAFALGTTITSTTLTTTASKRDFLTAIYASSTSKWYVVNFVKGY